MKNKPFSESFQTAVQKTWTDALKALQSLEDEAARRYRQVAERVDFQQEELQRVILDIGRRLQENSDAMEQRLEESVRSMTARLPKPMLDEVARLRTRAEQLAQRVETQLRRKESAPAEQDSEEQTAAPEQDQPSPPKP